MKNVPHDTTTRKSLYTPAGACTTAALLATIAEALDRDGSWIEPGSIDSQGLTVIAGVYSFRLEFSEPELLDWVEHSPPEPADRDLDWMADTDMPF